MGEKSKPLARLLPLFLLLSIFVAGCSANPVSWVKQILQRPEEAVEPATLMNSDLVVAGAHRIYSVDTESGRYAPFFESPQPLSGLQFNQKHVIATVFDPNNADAFKGFYDFLPGSKHPLKVETSSMQPRYSYLYGDLLFLSSADQTDHPNGKYSKVGIYDLAAHHWVKQWEMPGAIQDVKGMGKDVYFATGNNKETPSNAYHVDITTGEWSPLIQSPRWYPLDRVMVDTNGDVYFGITQRVHTEWSNKVYKYNPKQVPYELFDGFLSNTRPNSNDMRIRDGLMFISRYDTTNENTDIQMPLAVLDVKTKKQIYIDWDHRPVQIDALGDRFVAFAQDGTIALVDPANPTELQKEIAIEEIDDGLFAAAKRQD